MQELFREYLQAHGYWVLFLGTFLEGEAILIFAGFLAFQGYLDVYLVMLSALVGSFLGDQFYFHLGRTKGAQLLRLFTAFSRKFAKALRLIERYGTFVAFVSRYTYGFRIVLPVILGMTTFPSRRFLFLNFLSALTWSVLFSLAGYLFGKTASLFIEDLHSYEPYLMLALAGIIACLWSSHFVAHRWRKRHARARLKRIKSRPRRPKMNHNHR
ncbi:DedA family protein [Geomonas nitrogeniifigens]|uniref:DedA family protein n=1 Tax=Geomonas diazotrophica TaxID=2843197 RepID=UPI001C2BFD5F|nr:DedA family protein [Geomonas nitrogeniifigens]QXE88095.1 DedA family protein [Geomonas nitrogeniifigens]